jgi:predicted secreted protein
MTTPADRHHAIVTGTNVATRQGIRLGLDPASPVDIFGVIERERIWLLFEELEGLFGFFERQEDVAGVALHSGHPQSLQRFTAAHEYGHYVLGHRASQDDGVSVYGTTDLPVQEYEAQAFAAEFLMPLALVNRGLARLSLPEKPGNIDAATAYQLSLEIGASYLATVARLGQLNKISFDWSQQLKARKVMDLKVDLGGGSRPANSRAAVWSLDQAARARRIEMLVDDELHVRLAEVPSSGYRWAPGDSVAGLELVSDVLEEEQEEQLGGAMTRHLWFRAREPGVARLDLQLIRQWQGMAASPVDALSLAVQVVRAHNTAEAGSALAPAQREGLLVQA